MLTLGYLSDIQVSGAQEESGSGAINIGIIVDQMRAMGLDRVTQGDGEEDRSKDSRRALQHLQTWKRRPPLSSSLLVSWFCGTLHLVSWPPHPGASLISWWLKAPAHGDFGDLTDLVLGPGPGDLLML